MAGLVPAGGRVQRVCCSRLIEQVVNPNGHNAKDLRV